jgi:hypothetical protein
VIPWVSLVSLVEETPQTATKDEVGADRWEQRLVLASTDGGGSGEIRGRRWGDKRPTAIPQWMGVSVGRTMGGQRWGKERPLVHSDKLGAARRLREERTEATPGFRSRWGNFIDGWNMGASE